MKKQTKHLIKNAIFFEELLVVTENYSIIRGKTNNSL